MSASTLLGSPQRGNDNKKLINISPMKQRYLDSLKDTGLMVEPPLQPRSLNKINITSENKSPVKKGSISPFKGLSNFSAISTSSSKVNSPKKNINKDKENSIFSNTSDYKSAISSPFKEQSPNFLKFSVENPKINNQSTSSFKQKITILNNFDPSKLSPENLKCYNFLCRVSEAKDWINNIISETDLPLLQDSPIDLINNNLLKNGVYLATIVKILEPSKNVVVHPANCKFPYLLVENIELFLHFCYKLRIPDYFKFESVDLFEGKSFSNVIETIHCLAYYLNKSKNYSNKIVPMKNLYGILEFTSQDFAKIKRKMSTMGGLKTFEFFEDDQGSKSSVANKFHFEQDEEILSDFDSSKPNLTYNNTYKTPVKHLQINKEESETLILDTPPSPFKKQITIKPSYNTFAPEEKKEDADNDVDILEHDRSTPDVFTTSLLNQISNDIETRKNYASNHNNEYTRSNQAPSFTSGATLNNIDNIPKMAFDSKDEHNDLAYYSHSVNSQFSSPRRRRRRARIAGNFEQDGESVPNSTNSRNYLYDNISDYSSSTYVPNVSTDNLNYKAKNSSTNDFESCVVQFQSLIKASSVRYRKFNIDCRFEIFEEEIVSLQSSSKGYLARLNIKNSQPKTLDVDCQSVVAFQALLRGHKIREQNNKLLFYLLKNKYSIGVINDNIKGCLARRKIISALSRQRLYMPFVLDLQSIIRGGVVRNKMTSKSIANNDMYSVIPIQALLRANNLRNKMYDINNRLKYNESAIVNIQASLRAKAVRASTDQISSLVHYRYPHELNGLASYIKGAFLRNKLYKQMYELELLESSCTMLQSSVKGLLVRYCVGVVTDYVDVKETDIITSLQSSIKGYLIRNQIDTMNQYYNNNRNKVAIIQNKIRSHQLSLAYRDVMDSANPALKSVAKFVHLLNGTTPVHESEDKLNNLKDVIDSTNLEISKKEKNIMILAKKLMILKENVDNVDLLDDSTGSVHKILSSLSHEHSTGFGDSLSFIEIMQSYEKLLYLLQNDPFYFRVLNNEDPAKIEKFIKLIFYQNNGTINKRESILIIKLITEFLSFDIERQPNFENFLFDQDMNLPWKRQLHVFLVATRKGFMNSILYETVSKLKEATLSENMSFESDPLRIYQSLNRASDMSLSPQEAIEIPDVNAKYVSNMISLWSFVEEILQIIIDNLDCLPIEILHLCTKTYHVISTKSSDEFDSLEGISKILIGGFINDYLLHCEKYDPSLSSNSTDFKHNLQVLSNSLSTVFAMRKFKGYYQQLNSYVEEIGNDIASILSSLIIPPDFQNLADNMVYKDMNMVKPPLLTINAKYLTEIQRFLEDQIELLPETDPIIEILDSLSKSEAELHDSRTFKDSSKVVNLHLNPSSYVLSDVSNRSRPVYNTVMWGIVILLQVVDTKYLTNILEMLTHDDTDAEELKCETKLQQLLTNDSNILKTNLALNNGAINNYLDLKMNVTEKLVELDRLGLIDKNSKYQGLINDISNNLKTHRYFKERNLKEIDIVNDTIKILTDKLVKASSKYNTLENSFKNFLDNLKPNLNNSGTVKKHRLQFRSSRDKNKKPSLNSLQRSYTLKTLYEQRTLTKFKELNLKVLPVNYFGNGGVKYPHINFTISTNDGKTYIINMEKNGVSKQDKFTILKILDMSVANKELCCLDEEVSFNSSKLFSLLIKDFIA